MSSVTIPDLNIPDTSFRGKIRARKDATKLKLLKKGWTFDDLWWHSPYTGIRYPFALARDIEELREAWSGPDALDWVRITKWANQFGSGGEDMYDGPEIW